MFISMVLILIIFSPLTNPADNTFYYLHTNDDNHYFNSPQEMWYINGSYLAVVALSSKYLTIVDITTPETNISIASTFYLGSSQPRKLDISDDGDYIFVNTFEGLCIVNITDINNPTEEGWVNVTGAYYIGCAYVDETGYCFCTNYGQNYLTAFDCSDLTNPTLVDNVSVGNEPHGVWANETHALVVGHKDSKVHMVNVEDPNNMVIKDDYEDTNLYRCATVYGETSPNIYIGSLGTAGTDGGFFIFNTSDPTNIVKKSEVNCVNAQGCSAIPNSDETILYFNIRDNAGHDSHLYAYDITDKTNPSLLDSINGSDAGVTFEAALAGGMVVEGNYVFCGDGDPPAEGTDHKAVTVFRFGDEAGAFEADEYGNFSGSGESYGTYTAEETANFSGSAEVTVGVGNVPQWNITIRNDGVDYFPWLGENTTAYNVSQQLTGFDESSEYIGIWDNDTWDSTNASWKRYNGDGSGVNFSINTFDVVQVYLTDTGNQLVSMYENESWNYTNSKTYTWTNNTSDKGYNYTALNNETCRTLSSIESSIDLDSGEFIALWNRTSYTWVIYLADFGITDDNVEQWDVILSKVEDTETWTT